MTPHSCDVPTGALLQSYLANSPLALVCWDESVRFAHWSDRAEAIFGWSAQDVLGKTMAEVGFVFADDLARIESLTTQLVSGGVVWTTSENRNHTKSGDVVWCRWFNAFVARDEFRGFVSLAEDITEIVAAREALSANEERLRSLFTMTPDAMIFFDLDGTVTDANPAAGRLMRLPADALAGRAYATFVPPADRDLVTSVFEQIANGSTVSLVLPVQRPDGTTLIGNVTAGPIRSGNEVRGSFFNVHDVTEEQHALERLEESEERLRALFDNNPDPMLTLDDAMRITAANAATDRLFGVEAATLIERSFGELVVDADIPGVAALFDRTVAGGGGDAEVALRSGTTSVPTTLTMIPIRKRDRTVGVHVHVRDRRGELEQQRQKAAHADRIRDLYLSAAAANENAERQIAATLEAGCRILGMAGGAVYDTASDAIVASYGESVPIALARLAATNGEAIAIDDVAAHAPSVDAAAREGFTALIGAPVRIGGVTYGSMSFATREGRTHAFDAVDRDLVQLMGALINSAIERGRSRARLYQLAYTDTVTELPNRAWLIEQLRQRIVDAQAGGMSVGVLFLDLDRFKDINDTLGHRTGDQLLRVVGERLAKVIRNGDVVARMGGDEFVVLALNASDHTSLAALAERIITAVEEPVHLNDSEHFVTTSIGISSYPGDGRDPETLVKHADVAMYRAKDRGRNTYQFFTPALNATLQSRISQEKALRKALDNNEFVVYYQPQHDLLTGEMVAVEALVRWNHPRSGLLLPGHFIPSAEHSGLIVAIGDFVLETACKDVAELRREKLADLRLAVNLSARQFHQQRLARKIREILEHTKLDPTALELEITESVAMNDAEATIAIMRELGTEGVLLSVDDFGTGYSSLGYLKRFPLDSIKIDRSFVTDLASDSDDATIVRTVIAMAHALGLEVVAEGVESAEQLLFLREQNCDRVQGFFYSKAVSRAELEKYIRTQADERVQSSA